MHSVLPVLYRQNIFISEKAETASVRQKHSGRESVPFAQQIQFILFKKQNCELYLNVFPDFD